MFPSLKQHFSRSLAQADGRIHLAAHSHHLWPDASWDGQKAAWDEAATRWDTKWSHNFAAVLPAAQAHIARTLNLPDPSTITFAPNTHDFVRRLLSAVTAQRVPRVLTTDSEFHSLTRQLARLEEDGLAAVERVPVRPFATFMDRFGEAARGGFDLVFVSHVFFNSGWAAPDLEALVASVANMEALVAIDGYHGFMAKPTDLSAVARRAFYISGGYKYAMSGEGACFMHCPPGQAMRPRDTGWYAGFGALSEPGSDRVAYGTDGSRFLGATFDPSGLYRFNAVMDWFTAAGLSVADAHARAHAMQAGFVAAVEALGIPGLREADLVVPLSETGRGNFLAYESPHAPGLHAALMQAGLVTDLRGHVLRVGFGLYHDPDDVAEIADRVAEALTPRFAPTADAVRSAA